MEPTEIKGYWWLPDNPERKIAGILTIEPGEFPALALFGAFYPYNFDRKLPIVLGIASNSKLVTLYNCFSRNWQHSSSSVSREAQTYATYEANTAFVGWNFDQVEDVKFDGIRIHVHNLKTWARISGEQWHVVTDAETRYTQIIDQPTEASARVGNFVLSVKHDIPTKFHIFKQETEQQTFILVEFDEPTHFFELQKTFHLISMFLTLSMSSPAFPTLFEAYTKSDRGVGTLHYAPVSYARKSLREKPAHQMLFSFEHIAENFQEVLAHWFTKSDALQPVYQLYAASLDDSRMFLEFRFLALMQALETYHRRMKNRGKLGLQQRLTLIWNEKRESLSAIFQTEEDWKKFRAWVEEKRNNLTHNDDKHFVSDVVPENLYNYTLKLRFVVATCLLSEIGFSPVAIYRLIERDWKQYPESQW